MSARALACVLCVSESAFHQTQKETSAFSSVDGRQLYISLWSGPKQELHKMPSCVCVCARVPRARVRTRACACACDLTCVSSCVHLPPNAGERVDDKKQHSEEAEDLEQAGAEHDGADVGDAAVTLCYIHRYTINK